MTQNGYSNAFHHSSIESNAPLSVAASIMNELPASTQEGSELEGSSALDHALLESLFYNEMMMLNSGSPTSSNFLSHHFIEATHPRQDHVEPPITPCDPNTIAEKDLLRDFGVSASPVRQANPRQYSPDDPNTASCSAEIDPWAAAALPPPPAHPQHAHIAPAISVPIPVPISMSMSIPKPIPIYPSPTQIMAYSGTVSKPPAIVLKRPPLTIDTAPPPTVPEDRAKQLVDQFATLASRLGIELPNHVLQSLTAAAAKNDPQITSSNPSSMHIESTMLDTNVPLQETLQQQKQQQQLQQQHPDLSASSVPMLADTEEESTETGPATIQELRKTAEEAIASVTRKRSGADSDGTDSVGGSAKDGSKHGKRKKKPRLSDCESRLAELRAENEVLKRHLQNVSNKAQRFDQEKETAGKRIHSLLEENAGPDEMIQAVQEFTEMYSDYGRNRQQELSFHLEQLQR